jgi:hypothetical protein
MSSLFGMSLAVFKVLLEMVGMALGFVSEDWIAGWISQSECTFWNACSIAWSMRALSNSPCCVAGCCIRIMIGIQRVVACVEGMVFGAGGIRFGRFSLVVVVLVERMGIVWKLDVSVVWFDCLVGVGVTFSEIDFAMASSVGVVLFMGVLIGLVEGDESIVDVMVAARFWIKGEGVKGCSATFVER